MSARPYLSELQLKSREIRAGLKNRDLFESLGIAAGGPDLRGAARG